MLNKKLYRRILAILMTVIIWCSAAVNLIAQKKSNVKAEPGASCENIKRDIDYALIDYSEILDSTLILIFQAGKGESSKINKLRMTTIESYFEKKNLRRNYILAERSRKNEVGKIEIYVGGKLSYELLMKKNKIFCEDPWDT